MKYLQLWRSTEINVQSEEYNIVNYSVFVRYYAVHTICHNGLLIDHVPIIPRCTIAPKVVFRLFRTIIDFLTIMRSRILSINNIKFR